MKNKKYIIIQNLYIFLKILNICVIFVTEVELIKVAFVNNIMNHNAEFVNGSYSQ